MKIMHRRGQCCTCRPSGPHSRARHTSQRRGRRVSLDERDKKNDARLWRNRSWRPAVRDARIQHHASPGLRVAPARAASTARPGSIALEGGTQMSRTSRQNSFSGQFNGRLTEMLESPAYRVLSLSAHRVLSRIEIEHAHHGGKQEENGKLPVTYADFESYGVHHASIRPAISELEALGFIEITRRGRAGDRKSVV